MRDGVDEEEDDDDGFRVRTRCDVIPSFFL